MRIGKELWLGSVILAGLSLALLLTGAVWADAPETPYRLDTDDGLSLALSSDGQVVSLQVDGREWVAVPAPALRLRDLSQAGTITTPNLLPNPGFEDGLSGWAEVLNTGLDVSVVPSPTHGGGQALQLSGTVTTATQVAAYASDPLTVTPGQRYRLSAWFRSALGYVADPNGTPTLLQMKMWRGLKYANGLYVQWLDGGGQAIGGPQLAVFLHTNADHWRLIRRELTVPPDAAQVRVIIIARLSGNSLWVDDLLLVPSPEPEEAVTGLVAPCPAAPDTCLVQTATLTNGLTISLTYRAQADHIALHGQVVDATGRDRALDLSWGAPLTGGTWTWWDDAHTARPVTDTRLYAHDISAIYDGWLPISLYPYAGLGSAEGQGVALGLPLDRPQLALLAYDGATGRYGATYHLGISPQAVKVGPRADFDLLLYRFDPTWGFRDVIARHHRLQAAAYTLTLPTIYDYTGFSQDQYIQAGAQQALVEDEAHIYSAQYTLGELPLKLIPSSNPRPSLAQALRAVSDTQHDSHPWIVALGRAITQSAVVDTNDDWSLKHIGVYPWAPDWWEVSWAANLDPDLEGGLASYLVDWHITPALSDTMAIGAHLDGIEIDNFMSTPALDLRPEALAAADWPLVYTPHTYQPAVHTGFALREYLAFLRDDLETNWGGDRGITINFWGLGHPNYLASYLDAFGSEGDLDGDGEGGNWNPEILDYRRAIAYGRPYLFVNQTVGLRVTEAYTSAQLAMLYGVNVGRGANGADWEPGAEQVLSDTSQVVHRYWAGGWQPLTYARTDDEQVWVERFGQAASEPGLYFPVHNATDLTRTVTLTLESGPLGLTDPATVVITDIVVTQTLPFTLTGSDLHVPLTLGPRQTRVLQVGGGQAVSFTLYLPLVRADR